MRLTVSSDGRWWLEAGSKSDQLRLRNQDLGVVRDYVLRSADGKRSSPVGSVFALAQRKSFLVLLPGLPEIWEISLDEQAEPIFDGLVHDYRMAEGLARPGLFGVRRILLDGVPLQIYPEFAGAHVLVRMRSDVEGGDAFDLVHLANRRRIARVAPPLRTEADDKLLVEFKGRTLAFRQAASEVKPYCKP